MSNTNRKNKPKKDVQQSTDDENGCVLQCDESSPSLSRDSSTENYTDSTGTDLQQFLIDTLQKNQKDRIFLLKIEQDLTQLAKDNSRVSTKFAQMSSYNRMLVHRMAAFYGYDHNVDKHGMSVIVQKTKNTRIPDIKFRDYIKEEPFLLLEPKKSILKRDSSSFEDSSSQVSFDGKERSPERQTGTLSDSSRSKSFEEREELYEKARARIFNQDSSSSAEGNDGNIHVILDNGCNNGSNSIILQNNSSLKSSQEDQEDMSANWNNEQKAWSSTDSDCSNRVSDELKQNKTRYKDQKLLVNGVQTVPRKQQPLSIIRQQSVDQENQENQEFEPPINGEISNSLTNVTNNEQSNSRPQLQTTINQLNPQTQEQSQPQPIIKENVKSVRHPPVIIRQQSVSEETQPEIIVNVSHEQQHQMMSKPQQRQHNQIIRQQNVSQDHSHLTRQHSVSKQHRQQSFRQNSVPQQHRPQQIMKQQSISHQAFSREQMIGHPPQYQHQQQPIRLVYPNQSQLQNMPSFGTLVNNTNQTPFHAYASQMNHQVSVPVPYSTQSSTLCPQYATNIQAAAPVMHSPPITYSYGTQMPLQVPSGIGTIWIVNNGLQNSGNSSQCGGMPMPATPSSNTPTPPIQSIPQSIQQSIPQPMSAQVQHVGTVPPVVSTPVVSNIAPFVGMSYQQYHPTTSPNVSNMQALNSGPHSQHSFLKAQQMLTSHVNSRILQSNGNHYIQQVPELVDINLLGANNLVNRTPVIPNAQLNGHLYARRMPVNPNQAIRTIGSFPMNQLLGSQSSPFLLPTPHRPLIPVTNINQNNNRQQNQRISRNYSLKNNRQQRNNSSNITSSKNILAHSFNGSNT